MESSESVQIGTFSLSAEFTQTKYFVPTLP